MSVHVCPSWFIFACVCVGAGTHVLAYMNRLIWRPEDNLAVFLQIPSTPNSFRKGLFDLELLKQVWLVGQ